MRPSMIVLLVAGCASQSPENRPTDTDGPDDDQLAEPLQIDGPTPRNLLMLSLDTTRFDSLFGERSGELTPFLAGKAAQGVVLDDVTSCSSWTAAAVACVLSGATNLERAEARSMIPILHGSQLLETFPGQGDPGGPTPFLASWLADQGFVTVLSSANGFFSPNAGNAQGYQSVQVDVDLSAPDVSAAGMGLLDAARASRQDARWFLHLHFMEPHRPYTPPDEFLDGLDELDPIPFDLTTYRGQNEALKAYPDLSPAEQDNLEAHLRIRYEGDVAWFDNKFAHVWVQLEGAGLLDDTLVVFWTDHGEAFWEHGYQAHGKMLHGPENDVATVFWAPGLDPGQVSSPVSATDILPTVLTLLDLPIPDAVTGHPIGMAPDGRARSALVYALHGVSQMVVVDDLKLHFRWRNGTPADALSPLEGGAGLALFDRSDDPLETTNLYTPGSPPHPRLEELWGHLLPLVEQAEPWVLEDPRVAEIPWPEDLPR